MSDLNQLPTDEIARLYLAITDGLDKAWKAHKNERTSEESRELSAMKSDVDSLIRITKIKLKELEQEINA